MLLGLGLLFADVHGGNVRKLSFGTPRMVVHITKQNGSVMLLIIGLISLINQGLKNLLLPVNIRLNF